MRGQKKLPSEVREFFVEMGRKGGKLGGKVRASNMTSEERRESARNAVIARWVKAKKTMASGSSWGAYAQDARIVYDETDREVCLAERKVRVQIGGETVDAVEVAVAESTERWSEVKLEDDSVLRLKPVVIAAARVTGQYDPDGNPVYSLKVNQVMVVASAPDHLRRGGSDVAKGVQ